ncbi:BTB domain-containing protein [Mycena venus]|uniref:BTB domain-containing protein n=1 Tax=Mycena venus TaxID=2733690 RepID=A0A8H6YZX7_9AGAR|nr:BTB domain-containing protein [Mycena venus]
MSSLPPPSSLPADTVSVIVPTSPFHSPDTDVILRSSAGADFRSYRAVLSMVSPVFRDMFTLPQHTSASALPVVEVSETAAVLDRALRFFRPGAQPAVPTLNEPREILSILFQKYDI